MIKFDSRFSPMDEKEVTAYVQQQMVDLGPHLDEKSSLQVRLTKLKNGFEVELTAYQPEGEVQTVGRDTDLFDAIRNAKDGLLHYFVEIEDELHPHERDEKINHLLRNGNIYLH